MKTKVAVFVVIAAAIGVLGHIAFSAGDKKMAAQEEAGAVKVAAEKADSTSQENQTGTGEEVAVVVNEEKITEGDINAYFQRIMSMQNMNLQAEQLERFKSVYRPQIVSMLVDNKLMMQEVEKSDIEVTEKDYQERVDLMVEMLMAQRQWSKEELVEQLKNNPQFTNLEQFKKLQAENLEKEPMTQAAIKQDKFLSKKYDEKLKVTEADIKEYYQENLEEEFKKPEQVRASHILCSILDEKRQPKSEEEQQAAKEKIEELKKELAKEDVDFAALAKAHSDCPSSQRGGDLDFFTADRMVPEFSKVAFAMDVGEISDVVKTQFGYHIIKVTDKQEAETIPLEKADGWIEAKLYTQKLSEAKKDYIEEVKETAKIEYKNPSDDPSNQPVRPMAPGQGGGASDKPES